ncbi:23940_t:CDS:1, partial [Gigaspora margarita]
KKRFNEESLKIDVDNKMVGFNINKDLLIKKFFDLGTFEYNQESIKESSSTSLLSFTNTED